MEITDSMYTTKDLAKVLGFHEKTILRFIKEGKLPEAVKVGSSYRWRRCMIDEWIKAGCPKVA